MCDAFNIPQYHPAAMAGMEQNYEGNKSDGNYTPVSSTTTVSSNVFSSDVSGEDVIINIIKRRKKTSGKIINNGIYKLENGSIYFLERGKFRENYAVCKVEVFVSN